jgi:hypothetical protein
VFSFNNAKVQSLSPSHEESKVEVAIEAGDDVDQVVLRYSTWTEGLGWCKQKTIRMGPDQLDDLHRALTAARQRLHRKRAEDGELPEHTKVIQFPSLA